MKRKGLACLMAAVMLVTTPSATVLGSESETQVSAAAVDAESEAGSADAAEASKETAIVSETAGAGNEEESETETETESETTAEAGAGSEEKVGVTEEESTSAGADDNQAAEADTEAEAVEASDADAEAVDTESAAAEAEDAADTGSAEAEAEDAADMESAGAEAEDAEAADTESAAAEAEDAADMESAEAEAEDAEVSAGEEELAAAAADMESETSFAETEEDTEAATEEGGTDLSEEAASEGMMEEDEAMAASESAVSEEEEEPSVSLDWDNMVTNYYVLVGNTEEITFEVLLSSYTGTITYQWYDADDDSLISGATNSRYAVTPNTSAGWYDYYCTVTATTAAGSESSEVWFSVYVTDELIIDYDYYHAVAPGGTVTLSVEALSPNSEITYEWRVWNDTDSVWSEISGESASTLERTNVTASQSYQCVVSDGVSTSFAYFYVYIDSGLEVEYDNCDYYNAISPGETAKFSVSAATNYGSLTYQWYRYETGYGYVAISGATGTSYQTAVSGNYYCKVSDAYSSAYLDFYVYVESGLEAERNGDYEVSIKPGESEVLSVSASSDCGAVTYQWYYEDAAIEGATASAYTASESGDYYCLVSDAYNSEYIWFYVTVNSGLSVTYKGLTYALEGGPATMTVNASVDVGSLTYSWYYYNSNGSKVDLAETGNALLIDSVTEENYYYCRVSDDYGNYSTAYFEIEFVDEFTISYLDYYEIGIGESVTLSVQAVSPDGTITYQWYALDDEEEYAAIEGATSSAYTVTPTSSYSEYKCVVSDGVTTKNAYIEVEMTSNLSLSYTSDLSLDPGETGTLSVSAESDLADATYTFTWYKYDESEDDDVQIGDAESNTTGTSSLPVSEAGEYICRVTDSYETKNAWFYVEMNSGFEASADTTARLVETGGSATFSVTASTVLGTLSYSWYYYDSDGETVSVGSTASVTLSNLTTNKTYYCSVSDGYNSTRFSFRVVVVDEIGETAESFSEAKDMTLGTAQLATIASGGDRMYFKIVPTETASYTFYSLGDDDTYGYLYDATQSLLTSNDDGGENLNFQFTYTLTAGATYYLAVRYYDSDSVGTFNVYAIAGESTCSHENLGHVLKVDATCTSAGNIEYWYCKDCGAMFSDSAATAVLSSVTIAATGHSWNSGVVTAAPTTTSTGVRTYTCTVCGATKTEIIAKLTADSTSSGGTTDSTDTTGSTDTAHTHTATGTWVTTKEATCTETGTRVQYCKDCGTSVVVKSETIAATGHNYGEWTTTSEATVFASATQTRTCKNCGHTETREYGSKLTPTITVNASSIKLKKKQKTTALKVTGLAAGDSVVSWKSSNTKIVKVTSAGKITAGSKTGKATITITLASGLTKKIKVTVQKATVKTTKITVTSKKLSLSKGESYTLLPELKPITSGQKLTYKTSNKKVVTVNSKGKLVAKKKGTATITIKSGSKSVKVKVTVK